MSDAIGSHGWWLASRAAGLVAVVLVTASVALALMVAGRIVRSPTLSAIHQQMAVTAIVAIAVHGITLLGDPWLRPGIDGIAIPFSMAYRPVWTGLGIIAGYLAAIFGLSFYVRRQVGTRLWRRAHRLIIVVYVLAVVHTFGAGTDASTVWLRWWFALTAPVILVLFVARIWSYRPPPAFAAQTPARPGSISARR
jgi:methionine sulfoxide reductase heme-binding subunit